MYEEEEIVARFAERVSAALEGVDYELILVDDGSKDRTADAMAALAAGDPRSLGARARVSSLGAHDFLAIFARVPRPSASRARDSASGRSGC